MTSRDRVKTALGHNVPDIVPVDFGSTSVTGIHCKIVAALRNYYGLEDRPVKIIEPFQMLGEIDEELQDIIGVDCVPVFGPKDMFEIDETQLHEQITPWGQHVLIATGIDLSTDEKGDVYIYAKGDCSFLPSAIMPSNCYFINAIERQGEVDESTLDPQDNLEEFGTLTEEDIDYYIRRTEKAVESGKAVIASFGGTALGDIAFVPGMGLTAYYY